jgi:hypothetical protein
MLYYRLVEMLYYRLRDLFFQDIPGDETMEKQAKTRKPYTLDSTDAPWEIVEPMIPAWNVGRHGTTSMREVLNAIF